MDKGALTHYKACFLQHAKKPAASQQQQDVNRAFHRLHGQKAAVIYHFATEGCDISQLVTQKHTGSGDIWGPFDP